METLYKIYRNGELVATEENLSNLRAMLNLTAADTKKVFYAGVHKIRDMKIITFIN